MDRLSKDFDLYVNEWTHTQIKIWQEKIERLGVVRTGALHQSFRDSITAVAQGTTIRMLFLAYIRLSVSAEATPTTTVAISRSSIESIDPNTVLTSPGK